MVFVPIIFWPSPNVFFQTFAKLENVYWILYIDITLTAIENGLNPLIVQHISSSWKEIFYQKQNYNFHFVLCYTDSICISETNISLIDIIKNPVFLSKQKVCYFSQV